MNEKHQHSETCGHDHNHDSKCACGHDHNHDSKCACGHDHQDSTCICGHDHKAEGGVGHDRSMGRVCFALIGGILTVNSFLLEKLLPEQEFAASMSALLGAFILALPIIITACKDLLRGKVAGLALNLIVAHIARVRVHVHLVLVSIRVELDFVFEPAVVPVQVSFRKDGIFFRDARLGERDLLGLIQGDGLCRRQNAHENQRKNGKSKGSR